MTDDPGVLARLQDGQQKINAIYELLGVQDQETALLAIEATQEALGLARQILGYVVPGQPVPEGVDKMIDQWDTSWA